MKAVRCAEKNGGQSEISKETGYTTYSSIETIRKDLHCFADELLKGGTHAADESWKADAILLVFSAESREELNLMAVGRKGGHLVCYGIHEGICDIQTVEGTTSIPLKDGSRERLNLFCRELPDAESWKLMTVIKELSPKHPGDILVMDGCFGGSRILLERISENGFQSGRRSCGQCQCEDHPQMSGSDLCMKVEYR